VREPRPGLLVVFEGVEGAGKTTQIHRLAARLAERRITYRHYREPGGTPLGENVRQLLLQPGDAIGPRAEALLFMAARAQLVAQIEAHRALGEVLLLDRFFLSTYAYQVAGRCLPEGEVRAANRLATGGLVPDITLLLTIPAEVAERRVDRRGERDRMEQAGRQFHDRVAAAFAEFLDPAWGEAHPEAGPIVPLDGSGPPEAVERTILAELARRWPETFAGLPESQ
jgi:dTMP kinase